MNTQQRNYFWVVAIVIALLVPNEVLAQRNDIPEAIHAAYEAGTRSTDGRPGSAYWQIWPRYDLSAVLNPRTNRVSGSGTVRFVNTSPDNLDRIVLRLDQNRFKVARGGDPVTRGIDVTSITINTDTVDLNGPAVTGLSSTVLTVRVAKPIEPRDSAVVRLEWTYEVPEDTARLALRQGRWGSSVYQLGQWYPRLAMFDDLGGWDDAPHDGSSEFFNPFASFRVALHVPPRWIVGATGTLQNPEGVLPRSAVHRLSRAAQIDTIVIIAGAGDRSITNESTPWVFVADSISDFAWGASAEYSWTVLSSRSSSGKRIQLHILAAHRDRDVLAENAPRFAAALHRMSTAVTPYPWAAHTLLNGPEGGMEYPALTMTRGRIIEHEIAHQWFPMIVGTDESRFDFLDEGLATFYSTVAEGRPIPAARATGVAPWPLVGSGGVRQAPSPKLGYGRGSRMLQALVALHGERAVLEALRAYAIQWRFKHPTPWDFMASLETSLNTDLTVFWNEWLFSTRAVASSSLPKQD